MRLPSISPATYRRVTLVALVLLGVIVVSGGAVRLTGSGLGCSDWPNCEQGRLVAPLQYHPMIEFGNRMITGAVSIIVIVAVLGSLARVPRRRDLVRLSCGLVAGVLGQIVLGGLTVKFHLAPPLVMSHLLLSMAIVACAVVLHDRAGRPDDGVSRAVVSSESRRLGALLVVAAGVVVLLGTVVTGSGPHPGSHDGQVVDRLPFALHDVARLHGASVMLFLAMTVAAMVLLVRERAPRSVLVRAEVLLAVLVAQAGIGYWQYFTGVPALLVGFHIAGAVAVWVAVLRLALGFSVTAPATTGPAAAAGDAPERVLAST